MPGPAAAAAGTAVAENADEVAKAASDSKGFNIALVIGAAAAGYFVYRATNSATETADEIRDGGGDALRDLGGAAGDSYSGTQDFVSDGSDWWLGGGADTVENVGQEAGEGYEYVAGGTQDAIDSAASGAGDAADSASDAIGEFTGGLL